MEDQQPLHCSRLVRWMDCESRELHRWWKAADTDERAPHIAAWIGTCVHATVAGDELPAPPVGARFDKITPNLRAARIQIPRMAARVRETLDTFGIAVRNYEVRIGGTPVPTLNGQILIAGTIDMVAVRADEDPDDPASCWMIGDLKTGADTSSAWLQLGAYATMWECDGGRGIDRMFTIHCPRPDWVMNDGDDRCRVDFRMAKPCMDMATNCLERLAAIIGVYEQPTVSPGTKCQWCDNDSCAVRAHSRSR